MPIPNHVSELLKGPIWAQLGTRNAALVPAVHFAWGVRPTRDGEHIELLLSEPFNAGLRENIKDNGRVALTFVDTSNHASYQLKGRTAELREPTAEELAFQKEWGTKNDAHFRKSGIPGHLVDVISTLSQSPAVYLRMRVEEAYVQTPGPGAGAALPMDGS